MKHNHYQQLELIPPEFKTGIRVLVAVGRKKDGAEHKSDKQSVRLVSRDADDFDRQAKKLIDIVENDESLSRVYATVNPRNIEKAIREFKFNQLEADFYDGDSRREFYFDVKSRWISCLAKPTSRADSQFLLDCDSPEETKRALEFINRGGSGIKIIWSYPTKNGTHIICTPFNPNDLSEIEIKKDGMFLVHYK